MPQPDSRILSGSIGWASGDGVTRFGPVVRAEQSDPAVAGISAQHEHVASPAGDTSRWKVDHRHDQPADQRLRVGICWRQLRRGLADADWAEVDANGVTRVTWYRRSIYDRDVKATMTVTSDREDASIEIVTLTPEQASQGSWISWAPRRMFR